MSHNSEEAIALNEQLRLKMNEETMRSRTLRVPTSNPPRITPEIHQLACDANFAANRARDAIDSMVHGLPSTINELEACARTLLRTVDKLTTAIADEESR